MVNFIIYEDDVNFRKIYTSCILKAIGKMKIAYDIIEIDKYERNTLNKIKNISGKKIMILDIEVPGKTGLDLAREIRNRGDWDSQMIVVSSHQHLENTTLTARMLMLDFISKYYNLEEDLQGSISLALQIQTSRKSLNFQYNGEIFQIPYSDILYIEKKEENTFPTVVTKDNEIPINKNISTIENELCFMPNFYRSHRACIINIDNITKVDLNQSLIIFGKKTINYLSRDKKQALKDILIGSVKGEK